MKRRTTKTGGSTLTEKLNTGQEKAIKEVLVTKWYPTKVSKLNNEGTFVVISTARNKKGVVRRELKEMSLESAMKKVLAKDDSIAFFADLMLGVSMLDYKSPQNSIKEAAELIYGYLTSPDKDESDRLQEIFLRAGVNIARDIFTDDNQSTEDVLARLETLFDPANPKHLYMYHLSEQPIELKEENGKIVTLDTERAMKLHLSNVRRYAAEKIKQEGEGDYTYQFAISLLNRAISSTAKIRAEKMEQSSTYSKGRRFVLLNSHTSREMEYTVYEKKLSVEALKKDTGNKDQIDFTRHVILRILFNFMRKLSVTAGSTFTESYVFVTKATFDPKKKSSNTSLSQLIDSVRTVTGYTPTKMNANSYNSAPGSVMKTPIKVAIQCLASMFVEIAKLSAKYLAVTKKIEPFEEYLFNFTELYKHYAAVKTAADPKALLLNIAADLANLIRDSGYNIQQEDGLVSITLPIAVNIPSLNIQREKFQKALLFFVSDLIVLGIIQNKWIFGAEYDETKKDLFGTNFLTRAMSLQG